MNEVKGAGWMPSSGLSTERHAELLRAMHQTVRDATQKNPDLNRTCYYCRKVFPTFRASLECEKSHERTPGRRA